MRRKAQHGFTILELLVVIMIVTVLLTMLLPALGGAREAARKVVCAANLRAIGLAELLYSQENKRLLPPYPPGAVAPLSVDGPTFRDWLDLKNIGHDIFFCPSRPDVADSAVREAWWNFNVSEGFITYMNLTANNIHTDQTVSPLRIPPRYPGPDLALYADLMAERYVVPGKWSLNHSTKGPVGYSVYSDEPSGGNVVLIDGHVEWRNFSEVEIRYSTFKDHVYW